MKLATVLLVISIVAGASILGAQQMNGQGGSGVVGSGGLDQNMDDPMEKNTATPPMAEPEDKGKKPSQDGKMTIEGPEPETEAEVVGPQNGLRGMDITIEPRLGEQAPPREMTIQTTTAPVLAHASLTAKQVSTPTAKPCPPAKAPKKAKAGKCTFTLARLRTVQLELRNVRNYASEGIRLGRKNSRDIVGLQGQVNGTRSDLSQTQLQVANLEGKVDVLSQMVAAQAGQNQPIFNNNAAGGGGGGGGGSTVSPPATLQPQPTPTPKPKGKGKGKGGKGGQQQPGQSGATAPPGGAGGSGGGVGTGGTGGAPGQPGQPGGQGGAGGGSGGQGVGGGTGQPGQGGGTTTPQPPVTQQPPIQHHTAQQKGPRNPRMGMQRNP